MFVTDYTVFIGRFQPLHNAHVEIISQALSKSKNVIILIGSANSSRCPYNPFTFEERKYMIESVFDQHKERIHCIHIDDYPYNETRWISKVQQTVHDFILSNENPKSVILHGTKDFDISLIGHSKDASSFYLKKFPTWQSINVDNYFENLSATTIRKEYFILGKEKFNVPKEVNHFLKDFKKTNSYRYIKEWYESDLHNHEIWKNSPYPVTINCADCVVVQSGMILLVTRKNHPGKNLLALPGGHIDVNETILESAIRELREETGISDSKGRIPPAMLESFVVNPEGRLFDYPKRSSRGRVITHAFLFKLPESKQLYRVKGNDDAAHAQWYPVSSIKSNMMFEDHFHIIDTLLGGLND